MLPSSKHWEDDNPAPCPDCPGKDHDFCGGMGIIPRWVVEQWQAGA